MKGRKGGKIRKKT